MKNSTVVWVLVAVIVLLGAWYVLKPGQMRGPQPAVTQTEGANSLAEQAARMGPPVVLIAHDDKLGDYLVTTTGITLYSYDKDTAGVSNCSGTCAAAWPPYLHAADEPLSPGPKVTGKITLVTRADGSTQVAYNGTLLYTWKKDVKAGDVTGNNVGGFAVVKP